MKKVIFFLFICSMLACKKETTPSDITNYYWVLKTAVISPAKVINGKTTTDYKNAFGEGSCMTNYTLNFLTTGVYQRSSNGSLCDMLANTNDQKWTREGDIITLNNNYANIKQLNISGKLMLETTTFTENNVNYTIVYTYSATKK